MNLESSLAPIWKLTYYSGLMFDWCREFPKQSCLSKTLHYIVIFVSLGIELYLMTSYAYQLGVAFIRPQRQTNDLVFKVIVFFDKPITLFTWIYFLLNRYRLLTFFKDWSDLERKQVKGVDLAGIRRTSFSLYAYYFSLAAVGISIYFFNSKSMTNSVGIFPDDLIASYHPFLADSIAYSTWLRLQTGVGVLLLYVFFTVTGTVPVLVYYHASKMVEAIKLEIREFGDCSHKIDNECQKNHLIRNIWLRFESLRLMINRANDFFGCLILLTHCYLFLALCGLLYALSYAMRNQAIKGILLPPVVYYLVLYSSRLVIGILIMSKVDGNAEDLTAAVSHLAAERSGSEEKEERSLIKAFLNSLQHSDIAASTCGFYRITPSFLLTLIGLIVSYAIVLLQSDQNPKSDECPPISPKNVTN